MHTLGVTVFFSISGYLITASWSRSPDPLSYFAARCLRIFPALAAVVLVTVFVLGPLVTELSTGDYFGRSRTWEYLENIVLRQRHRLPGVFTDLPRPGVNGSLWSLSAEFVCYLLVPLVLLWRRAAPVLILALLACALVVTQVPYSEAHSLYGLNLTSATGMWSFFAAGALLRLAQERWSGLIRRDIAVVLLVVQLLIATEGLATVRSLAWLTIPYVVLAVGLSSTRGIRQAARYGDFSYGLYLWAFPVQQLVIMKWGVLSTPSNLVLVVAFTLIPAIASWHLVERPALALRERVRRGPGPARPRPPVPASV